MRSTNVLVTCWLGFAAGQQSIAYELSEEALFHRCYGQLTQERPKADSPILKKVMAGEMTAQDGCAAVLQMATLAAQGGTQLTDPSGPGQAVIQTMHNLHAGWFSHTSFPDFADATLGDALGDLYDTSTPALYFTRALFKPGTDFSSVTTLDYSLKAVRIGGDPSVGPQTGKLKSSYVLGSGLDFAPVGKLVGIDAVESHQVAGTPFVQGNSFGGGILGDVTYLLQTSPGGLDFKQDGAVGTQRRYAKAVLRDLMCQDLPVVHEADAKPFVDPDSLVPFRANSGCTSCHATLDRMAGVVRGFTYSAPTSSNPALMRGVFVGQRAATSPSVVDWPAKADAMYADRPTDGNLFYRNHAGKLIDRPIASVADLGEELAKQDEIYVCAVKRYYRYFLGIDVIIGDPTNPSRMLATDGEMARHRRTVIRLGQELKSEQKVENVIKKIMNLPEYKRSEFATGGN